ncbi:MAG: hypothetical protein WEC14_05380, partial [Chloroflexota bacterium]
MARSTTSRGAAAIIVSLALIAVVAVMATGAFGRTPTPSPTPGAPTPTAQPSVAPSPTAEPTAQPSAPSGGFDVDLDTADGHDVSVVVKDGSGTVTHVKTGQARDGMSVRWHDVEVENVDADTLRITWAGWSADEVIHLDIARDGDGYALTFTEKLPYPNTDAMGADRVVVVDFDAPVKAS